MSLFKGKRNDESNGQSVEGGLKYGQVFTGQVFVTPLIFNPTGEQIKEIKKLPDSLSVNEPVYITEKTINKETGEKRVVRRISLLTSFNPNIQLSKDNAVKYGNEYFYTLTYTISPVIVVAEKTSKVLVMDAKMNSAWIPADIAKVTSLGNEYRDAQKSDDENEISDLREKLTKLARKVTKDAAAAMGDVAYGAAAIDLSTVRFARDGEEPVAKLIFDMSSLSPVRYMSKTDAKKMQKDDAKKFEKLSKEYEEFDFSHVEMIFDLMLNGQMEEVNKLIFDENKEFFQSDEIQNKVGIFFGANQAEDGKIYQSNFGPYGKFLFGQEYTFKKAWKTVKSAVITGFEKYGETFMSKNAAKRIADADYGYSDQWQGSFKFQPFVAGDILIPESSEKVSVKTETFNDYLKF